MRRLTLPKDVIDDILELEQSYIVDDLVKLVGGVVEGGVEVIIERRVENAEPYRLEVLKSNEDVERWHESLLSKTEGKAA